MKNETAILGLLLTTTVLTTISFDTTAKGNSTNLNWNHISAGYMVASSEDEGIEMDLSGLSLNSSFAVSDNIFVMAEYKNLSDDVTFQGVNIDVSSSQYLLGIGASQALTQDTSVFGIVGFANIEAEAQSGAFTNKDDFDGAFIRAGVRSLVQPKIEMFGFITYGKYDVDTATQNSREQEDDESSITIGARYYAQPNFSLSASYEVIDDGGAMSVSASYLF